MAAPVQRGTVHATFTAPTSTVHKIDAETFRLVRTGDLSTYKNEGSEDFLEVISNPGIMVSYEGTLIAAQTPLKKGDLVSLTFPASHSPTGAVEMVVVNDPEDSNYGKVIRQTIQAKYNAAAGDYSP